MLLVRIERAAYNAGEIMSEADFNASDVHDEPGGETRPDARGGLVDVPFEKDITNIGLIVVITCVSTLVAVVAVVMVIQMVPLGPLEPFIICSVMVTLVCAIMAAVLKYEQNRRTRVSSVLDKSAALPLAQRIGEVLQKMRCGAPQKMVRSVVTQLARERPWGNAVRIGPGVTLTPQTPIQFAFEPRRLTDLTDLATVSLEDSEHAEAKYPRDTSVRHPPQYVVERWLGIAGDIRVYLDQRCD